MKVLIDIAVKVVKWVPLNIVSVFGILQAVIKLAKEIVTAVVNFLASIVILIPGVDLKNANAVVEAIRAWIEKADAGVEKVKVNVLKWVHA